MGLGAAARPNISFERERNAVVVRYSPNEAEGEGEGEELLIPPAVLRRSCRCAAAVDEITGEQLLMPEHVPDDVEPMRIENKGNYAFGVTWTLFPRAKGSHAPCAQCIYPYSRLRDIAASAASTSASM